jgi:hypothetical protein
LSLQVTLGSLRLVQLLLEHFNLRTEVVRDDGLALKALLCGLESLQFDLLLLVGDLDARNLSEDVQIRIVVSDQSLI